MTGGADDTFVDRYLREKQDYFGLASGAVALLAIALPLSSQQVKPALPGTAFAEHVQPFLAKNCYLCHNAARSTAGLNLEAFSGSTLEDKRTEWEHVLARVEAGEMPPKGLPRPEEAAQKAFVTTLTEEFSRQDKLIKPDPGRVTARRLNRAEYNNTVRDLLAVDFNPAGDFPQDDSGYGFDNIGDVLSLSPGLMEKYLTAADKVSRAAVYGEPAPKPTFVHYQPFLRRPAPPATFEGYDESGVSLPSALNVRHLFPAEADYLLKITLNGQRPGGSEPVMLNVAVDGKSVQQFSIEQNDMEGQSREFRTHVAKGEHMVSVSFLKQFEGLPARFGAPNPSQKAAPAGRVGRGGAAGGAVPAAAGRGGRGAANVAANANANAPSLAGRVDALDLGGPFDAKPEPPVESLKKVFICSEKTDACARKILGDLARRAYRRPVSAEETASLLRLYAKVRAKGDSFNEGIVTSMSYILASPDFLFRIEGGSKTRALNAFEEASRLSYFLWSSTPDEELYRAAAQGKLRNPAALDAQVRRMLKDPKSSALVDNFAGQWLELRNVDLVKPDWERFEQFDELLRYSMKRETELFLTNMIQEDRSVLDMIGGRYSYLNERLARFYGIPGVTGFEFRKVDLTPYPERSGILTQGSILTVSSYATRTSPVLRGKWILENILNTPPPPPPPDVPTLEVNEVGSSVSLRQQLEKHRANPACATCHARMDPLGFSLENYDAIGSWRTQDGKFEIDASGKLPDGRTFKGADGLKSVLMTDQDQFARALAEKLLIYALGRGLERFDKPVVAEIVKRAAPDHYKFSDFILGIVHSMPFEIQRGDNKSDVRHS